MHTQTWDLMRLLYFGFTGFCADFTATYGPDHYVVPVRINGSAIESLFGRFKFDAGGNLSAINYEAALSRVMTADAIARTCTDSYRNSELNVKGDKIMNIILSVCNLYSVHLFLCYCNCSL